jgi:hypothetical protein
MTQVQSPVTDTNGTEQLDFSQSRAAKKQHDKIVAWSNEKFRAIRNARVVTERQWYYNLAFFFGKQNIALLKPQSSYVGSGPTTRLYVPPAPYYRARPVINRIRPTVLTQLAQLTNNKPNASITPASAEDRDMYAAMAGEQIWENFYDDRKIKFIIRRALWWTLTCGTGFIKTYWDFQAGPPSMDPNTGMPILDEKTGKPVPMGDICFTPETPFHVLVPDFREEEIENQPFLIHAKVKSPEWVKMNFGQALDGSEINPSDAGANDLLEESFLNLIGTQSMNRQQSVLILEVWVKPGMHPMFPEGAFYTLVGDKIVYGQQGWPYSHGKFPFSKFDHIPAGKFYSTSSVEDLIPLQKEYNRTRGQIIEAKNRMAKPQLIAPRGSVDPSKITSEPGQVILYTPGFNPPQPLPLQALPQYVTQELDRIITDWNDISGQHEVTHGQIPPGVTAATAISYLQERDESKLSPTFDSLEEGIEKTAQIALSYVHDYWDLERTVKITGPDGSFDAAAFKGSDLGNNLDIKIEAGSALPVSKAAKQALIMDMMKMGFIDPNKGLEVMEMGGINKIYDKIQIDKRQAQRENLKMSKTTAELMDQYNQQNMQMLQANPQSFDRMEPPLIVPVNSWDNHKAHIEYHNDFRKGQAYDNLTPEAKTLIEAHVQQHVAALGIESVSMDPNLAAGLPPMPEDPNNPSASQEGPSNPGPEPMPQGMDQGAPQ